MFEFGAKPTQTSLPGYNLPCVALTLPGERSSECTGTAKGPLPSRTLDLLDLYVPQSFINKQGLTSILIQKIQITTIEELKLAGGYLSTDKRKEQSVERYPPPPSRYPSCWYFQCSCFRDPLTPENYSSSDSAVFAWSCFFIMTRANTRWSRESNLQFSFYRNLLLFALSTLPTSLREGLAGYLPPSMKQPQVGPLFLVIINICLFCHWLCCPLPPLLGSEQPLT